MRRTYNKVCPVCGVHFEGIARRLYDRQACQVKAYRQRRRLAPDPDRGEQG